MTRKDYVLIAAALKAAKDTGTHEGNDSRTFHIAVDNLAARLAQDNPRFDRERFLKAAGVQS